MTKLKYRKCLDNIASYTPAKSLESLKQEYGLDNIIKLAANENNLGFSPLVETAIHNAIKDIFLYPDMFCTKLRSKLTQIHNIKENQLIFGNGSFELLSLVAQAFISPGEESIIPIPSFGWYINATLSMDGVVIRVPLKNHSIDLENIKSKITDKTSVIWICNPNNPTGTILSKKQLEDFLVTIPTDVIIVLDEAYYEYINDVSNLDTISLIEKYPNIIILRTFSKIHGLASLRIGYGIAAPEVISILNKVRLPININALAQVAALASLDDLEFKQKVLTNNINGKDLLIKLFNELNLDFIPSQTNFIMVNVKKDSTLVFNELLKKGISIRPGLEFGMPTWLRITIGRPEENLELCKKLKEVLNSI